MKTIVMASIPIQDDRDALQLHDVNHATGAIYFLWLIKTKLEPFLFFFVIYLSDWKEKTYSAFWALI